MSHTTTHRRHKCAARYCNRKCPVAHLLCRPHWDMLPLARQLAVVESSKALEIARDAKSPNLGAVKIAYFDAGSQAVKAVAKYEKTTWGRKKNAESAGAPS